MYFCDENKIDFFLDECNDDVVDDETLDTNIELLFTKGSIQKAERRFTKIKIYFCMCVYFEDLSFVNIERRHYRLKCSISQSTVMSNQIGTVTILSPTTSTTA